MNVAIVELTIVKKFIYFCTSRAGTSNIIIIGGIIAAEEQGIHSQELNAKKMHQIATL